MKIKQYCKPLNKTLIISVVGNNHVTLQRNIQSNIFSVCERANH